MQKVMQSRAFCLMNCVELLELLTYYGTYNCTSLTQYRLGAGRSCISISVVAEALDCKRSVCTVLTFFQKILRANTFNIVLYRYHQKISICKVSCRCDDIFCKKESSKNLQRIVQKNLC